MLSILPMAKAQESPPSSIGLCADCRHMRLIKTDRGATFYFCQRSATDPKFPKYPRLPVRISHCDPAEIGAPGSRQESQMPQNSVAFFCRAFESLVRGKKQWL